MGIVGGVLAYMVFAAIRRVLPKTTWWFLFSAGVAAWFSVVAGSAACAIELAVSGTVPMRIALPAMAGVHALIGIGEAVITTVTSSAVLASRPDLVHAWSGTTGVAAPAEAKA
jgi:cobalt/nickel transport system permease protein